MVKTKIYESKLDMDEQKLLESVENGEWTTIADFEKQAILASAAATNYLRKDARVNIRISSSDLTRLKQKAAYKGMPYQTLLASVLHEYAAGHFEV